MLKYLKLQELNQSKEEEIEVAGAGMVAAHIQVEEIEKEVVIIAVEIEKEEGLQEAHLIQKEKAQEEQAVQEVLALLEENLMLL